MRTLLITGGAGFIGSHFVRKMLKKYPDYRILNVDALTYAGNLENLSSVKNNPQYSFFSCDITSREVLEKELFSVFKITDIVHFAAESHVDRSILDSTPFIHTNVLGTQVLLDLAKTHEVSRFVHVSTDEVYGSLGETGVFTETTPISPNSPYAASKAASDLLVRSFYKTFGLPAMITRCSNNYGPNQFPEKLIPLMIKNAESNQTLPVYGTGENVRDWIHVEDHCEALDLVLHQGVAGDIYNIGSSTELSNLTMVKKILEALNKPESLIDFVKDRLGHDFRYAIDSTKIRETLGWVPKISFEAGLLDTIQWYQSNSNWVQNIVSGDYRNYYEKQYGERNLKL